ncbi:glutamine--fructose-6-phosphate transaminase (isomerizing) [Woodsholea maritima]|uniref:glutamine--fructose-6-phosphate transaminase (isomerizing) n=1 Tax=Woodsholea maritima TaxID=240237 RepID=UPI000370132B|nr:glutamine--fructose-6-phosphate transaminase (isomerizing) [Woodsholea maritima]
MCGIVAVVGCENAAEDLLEGLRRLEYRGYDSAGLALVSAQGVQRWRAKGKVADLEAVMASGDVQGVTGIAHTRWATHGVPNEANAHPHQAGQVSIVHNGIIENFKALRQEVTAKGRVLTSDTDTEVIAHLLDLALEAGAAPQDAFMDVVARLHGAFALAVLMQSAPEAIFGARKGAPLVVGLSEAGHILASDTLAFAGKAHSVIYLDEGDRVRVEADQVTILDAAGRPVNRAVHGAVFSAALAEKGPYRHFMEKEIHEQPEVVGRTLTHYLDAVESEVRAFEGLDFKGVSRLLIVGCGTASYAGRVAEYWFEKLANLPVEVDIASEFRYRAPAFLKDDVALFISQSGETADTLEAMRLCQAKGVKTIVLVNAPHSTMAREADLVVPILAGPEIGVASTKAFTCQISALAALAVMAATQRGTMAKADERAHVSHLIGSPGLMATALELEDQIIALAHEIAQTRTVLYLGRDQFYPMALEGALKLKEISYIHAEGYAAGELKHGPIALIEEGVDVIVIAPHDELFDKTRSSIEQVKSRGARVIVLTDQEGSAALADDSLIKIVLPEASYLTSSLVMSVGIQLLAYHVAVHKGTDVDQPRNLAKSVTVE